MRAIMLGDIRIGTVGRFAGNKPTERWVAYSIHATPGGDAIRDGGERRIAIRRDAEKGGDGWRSTIDIAERLGVKAATARRELNKLYDAGLLDWDGPIEGLGAVHFWRLAEPDDGEKEPVPANDNETRQRLAA